MKLKNLIHSQLIFNTCIVLLTLFVISCGSNVQKSGNTDAPYPDFKLAVTYVKLRLGSKQANLTAIEKLIDDTVAGCKNDEDGKGPDMIVLSESVHSRGNNADQQFEETDGPLMQAMAKKGKEHNCYIVYNFYEERSSGGNRYNTK